jgi:hypothetical protein
MTSSSAIQVSAGCSRIAILRDKLRLTVRAHAAIGSQEERGRSPVRAL